MQNLELFDKSGFYSSHKTIVSIHGSAESKAKGKRLQSFAEFAHGGYYQYM